MTTDGEHHELNAIDLHFQTRENLKFRIWRDIGGIDLHKLQSEQL